MYTFVFLLVSFGVVFPKLCLTSIQLKKVKKKNKPKTLKKPPRLKKLMPVPRGSMEAGTPSSTQAKAGHGCSAGGAFPGVLPGTGTQQCWGRTRRGNSSSDVPVSQLAWDRLPQRPAARSDPAPAVVFPGEVACGYETSLGKAVKIMCL